MGAIFSANASTLPWAEKTGNLTVRPDSVVESIIYDQEKGRATGVRIIDRHTKEATEFYAKIIFVNASTINSNAILLNSKSDRFPNGLGNDNGLMGKFMACHNYRGKGNATFEGFFLIRLSKEDIPAMPMCPGFVMSSGKTLISSVAMQ